MECTFEITKEINYDSFVEANKKLYNDMVKIAEGAVKKDEVLAYAYSLIDSKRIISSRELYFWFEACDTAGMDGDVRVELIYLPTYMAVCILARAYMYLEEDGKDYEPLTDALYRGLNGAMGRNFIGHGYDAEEGLLDTFEIFRAGRLDDFIETHPAFNLEFTMQYTEAKKSVQELKDAWPSWGDHHFEEHYIKRQS